MFRERVSASAMVAALNALVWASGGDSGCAVASGGHGCGAAAAAVMQSGADTGQSQSLAAFVAKSGVAPANQTKERAKTQSP